MRDRRTSTPRRERGPAQIAAIDFDVASLDEPIVVSSLIEVPGRAGRARIALNGENVGDLTLDYITDNSIGAGRSLSRHEAQDVVGAVARTVVLDKALDLLAVRARSARDLRLRLRRAGADDAAISWSIDRLTAQGFVDDGAYARQVARAKVVSGGVSRRKVVTVLRRRGIDAAVADAAIDDTLQEVDLDEEGAALAAARKRLRALASLDPAKRRQRLHAYLARRGYESDVVRRVLAEVLR
jgi:regulatory protein